MDFKVGSVILHKQGMIHTEARLITLVIRNIITILQSMNRMQSHSLKNSMKFRQKMKLWRIHKTVVSTNSIFFTIEDDYTIIKVIMKMGTPNETIAFLLLPEQFQEVFGGKNEFHTYSKGGK